MKNNTFKNATVKQLDDAIDNIKQQCVELLSHKHGYKFETNDLLHLPESLNWDNMYACVTGGDGIDLTISYGSDPDIFWDPDGWVHDEVPESEETTINAWDLSVDDLILLLTNIEKAGYEENV